MQLLLEDIIGNIWAVTTSGNGNLVVTLSSGSPNPSSGMFLTAPNNQVWQVLVSTSGVLSTVPGASSDMPQYGEFDLSGSPNYALYVNTLGQLQTKTGIGTGGWIPNGGGAGEDNSVVGGGGGYMAYPQPPTGPKAAFNPPENNVQAGPINAVFNSGTGNYFVISNPGRSSNS